MSEICCYFYIFLGGDVGLRVFNLCSEFVVQCRDVSNLIGCLLVPTTVSFSRTYLTKTFKYEITKKIDESFIV